MTVCGKHGKTIKLFSHPFPSPWKSLRRFPHSHRHDYDDHEFLSKPVKTKTRRNDAQYHYPGGPNQMVKVGHAGIANSSPSYASGSSKEAGDSGILVWP
jgi:hypothetical protein